MIAWPPIGHTFMKRRSPGLSTVEAIKDLARLAAAKMCDDLNRADDRVDAMLRVFGIKPPPARRWGENASDAPTTLTPRSRGAVASWVLGRFAPT